MTPDPIAAAHAILTSPARYDARTVQLAADLLELEARSRGHASAAPQPLPAAADSAGMLDLAALAANPTKFARAFAHVLGGGARLLDGIADRTAEPAWRALAVELDRLALQLRELAEADATAKTPPIARA